MEYTYAYALSHLSQYLFPITQMTLEAHFKC